MVQEIGQFDRELLLDDVREVHQAKGTSEYAFLIEELKCVKEKYKQRDDILSIFQPAIDAYRAGRRRALRLYSGVADAMKLLKSRGVTIVAYTESKAFYTGYRVRTLGLDGLIDYLYSPLDDDVPPGVDVRSLRFYEEGHYTFCHTVHRHTPKGSLSPILTFFGPSWMRLALLYNRRVRGR